MRQNRQNERERGSARGASGSVTVSYGRGIPPGRVKVQEKNQRKERTLGSKRKKKKRWKVSREDEKGGEYCFDVKVTGGL